jgi:ferric-dicitrate binding protein FerR (iron transport regulator)
MNGQGWRQSPQKLHSAKTHGGNCERVDEANIQMWTSREGEHCAAEALECPALREHESTACRSTEAQVPPDRDGRPTDHHMQ